MAEPKSPEPGAPEEPSRFATAGTGTGRRGTLVCPGCGRRVGPASYGPPEVDIPGSTSWYAEYAPAARVDLRVQVTLPCPDCREPLRYGILLLDADISHGCDPEDVRRELGLPWRDEDEQAAADAEDDERRVDAQLREAGLQNAGGDGCDWTPVRRRAKKGDRVTTEDGDGGPAPRGRTLYGARVSGAYTCTACSAQVEFEPTEVLAPAEAFESLVDEP
jgi:hypothetical protein